MYDADTLVERLGVDGTRPDVQAAAAAVVAAYETRDVDAFVAAITEFEAVVRRQNATRLFSETVAPPRG
jgi:hypothetical protein